MDIKDNEWIKRKEEPLYYVGIGASAGGLEALQDFFKMMPVDTGMAFIVIQHLSPDYKSLMDELLARYTKMPIIIASDGIEVEANTIYLIPPRKNLSLFHGRLFLEDQQVRKGLNLPIDVFFRSLALDKGKRGIGIILSGTGSDGTLGIRAIKEAGGMVIVQDDQSAKFDGMPKSSISTGLVDYILTPAKMAEELTNFIRHPFVRKSSPMEKIMTKDLDALSKIILILRDYTGTDFSYYKENTIIRRVERRVSINKFDTIEEYLMYFSKSDLEKDILYRELLIGVTRFFRDQEAFNLLQEKVLPEIMENKKTIRIWSAGCSTGEEVYSLAMLFKEYMVQKKLDREIKIFATDIDRHAIEFAGQGLYPESLVADIDPILLMKYFSPTDSGYQIKDDIRKMIVFATHNILKDPPFSKLDLLVCRNLFIYLKPGMQQKLLGMFYYSLCPQGFLLMGSSETVGEMSEAFNTIDSKWKIYRCKSGYKPPITRENPILISHPFPKETVGVHNVRLQSGIKMEALLETAISTVLPPSIIVDYNDNIIHVINDVNKLFNIKPGRFSQNLFSNLSNELALFVKNLLRRLKNGEKQVNFENISGLQGYDKQKINIEGRVISTDKYNYFLLTFVIVDSEVIEERNDNITFNMELEINTRVAELEKELKVTKENLQATVEELETSNEELQSSNEELIASNEELQSTNEELQSVNEELYSVNSEYQVKINELTQLNNDLNNLLKNTEVGALYIDRHLCIRKITPTVSKITNILASDIGRPISHIAAMGHYPEILEDVNKVVETLQTIDKDFTDANNKTWFTRLRPYRTEYNAIEGVLVTFVDISQLKSEELRYQQANSRLNSALQLGNMAWWEWDVKTGEVVFEDKKATMLGYTVEEFPKDVYEVCNLIHPEDYERTMEAMRDHLTGKAPLWDVYYRIKRKDGSYAWYYDRGAIIQWDDKGAPVKLIGTVIDVSRLKGLEQELSQSRQLMEKVLDNSPIAKTMVDTQGNIVYANKKAEEIFGITQEEILNRNYDSWQWKITGLDGKEVPSDQLPFAVIKKTHKSITDYKHYIEVPNKVKILLSINGVPIIGPDNTFEGAVFTIGVDNYGV